MMRRVMAFVFAAIAFSSVALAVEPDEKLDDPILEARARNITRELRCVVCQNQSVDDSNAPLAHDMRVLVRDRIKLGETDEQVRAFIVARYGNFVLLKPPLQADTLFLWFSPLLFLAIASALLWSYLRSIGNAARAAPLNPTEEAQLKQLAEES